MIQTMLDLIDTLNTHGKEISTQSSEGDLLAQEILHFFAVWACGGDGDSQAMTKLKLDEWMKREGKCEK